MLKEMYTCETLESKKSELITKRETLKNELETIKSEVRNAMNAKKTISKQLEARKKVNEELNKTQKESELAEVRNDLKNIENAIAFKSQLIQDALEVVTIEVLNKYVGKKCFKTNNKKIEADLIAALNNVFRSAIVQSKGTMLEITFYNKHNNGYTDVYLYNVLNNEMKFQTLETNKKALYYSDSELIVLVKTVAKKQTEFNKRFQELKNEVASFADDFEKQNGIYISEFISNNANTSDNVVNYIK